MEHAPYGGSTIKRTHNCPAWVEFCKPLPKGDSSEFADRGSLLHIGMDTIYREDADFDARSIISSKYKDQILTAALYDEKIVPAMAAVEEIFDLFNVESDDDFLCESRVEIDPEIWGTSDLFATGEVSSNEPGIVDLGFHPDDMLKVGICADYKFGDGIIVDAFENEQGLFYAVAAAMTEETKRFFTGIDVVAIIIIQPNDRGVPDYSIWYARADILETTREKILRAVTDTQRPNPDFCAGDWCRFCPGEGLCPPTSGALAAIRRLDVTAPDILEKIPTFSELAEMESAIKSIRKLVHSQLEEGVDVAGFKLVPKRASRSYTSEEEVREIVKRSRKIKREDAYTDSLLTPPQLEKMCKRLGLDFEGMFGELVQKVSSGTTLAAADDPRQNAGSINALRAALTRD